MGGEVLNPSRYVYGLTRLVPKLGKSALFRGAATGFVVDGIAFEPGENLMNMMQEAGVDGSFIEWFKAKETDTDSEKIFI